MSKLVKIALWHDDFAKVINEQFTAIDTLFCDAVRKAVWLGMLLNYAKEQGKLDKSIPHGEFGPFLKRIAPELKFRRAQDYMLMARNVAEKGKFQIRDFRVFALGKDVSIVSFLGDGKELPAPLRQIKAKVDDIIEGKTQHQLLLLDVKQVEPDEEGELRIKHGRLQGQGGASAAHRAKHKALTEAAQIEADKLKGDEFMEWIDEAFDASRIDKIDDDKWREKLCDRLLFAARYLQKKEAK